MAVYKVPQDVEAEDKLIGPFSFRQFGYLLGVGAGAFVLFLLFTRAPMVVAAGFALILLPPMILLTILALPLKKDQPMETYLIAVVRFFFKPRIRLWAPDGSMALVDITVPKTVETQLTKSFSSEEADDRLAYLAGLMDSRGWSAKGVAIAPPPVTAISDDTEDVLDDNAPAARSFEQLLAQDESHRRQAVMQRMHEPPMQQTPQAVPDSNIIAPQFAPYPKMHQHVINPAGKAPATPPQSVTPPTPVSAPTQASPSLANEPLQSASAKSVSPDIIRLAENKDLSISAIAHEANRLKSKKLNEDEVVISLR